ncbi:alpha/beta hydrolase fold-3 [Lucifera butyrica]|uniref:Alpha/beta hydrolase fold-3 n=1 Tax=Lucifera butyrica TaxID=1351585 RepID=A0A498RBR5_9FIRM|nr:alpha/beta hydrolase [Lucifera butyrica]VBB07702.1 alpha/beta hydrolase fold-3 [Lucifera butyrica]
MPSLRSRLFAFVLRHRHLLRFQLQERAWDFNTSIPDFRRQCEEFHRVFGKLFGKRIDGIKISPAAVAGLPAEWLIPDGAAKDKVILYAIGGAYVSGSCQDHRRIVSKIAKGSGVSVLLVEHRLAPEHPFPAALDDMVTAYRWLLAEGILPSNIMIVGESAGGGLCLATLLALRDQGIPLPEAAVALSPWTDLNQTGESHRTNADVCLSPKRMAHVCSKYYAGDNDPCLPWISPLYGDLYGLPPILIQVGGDETLLDDSTRFAAKAKAAGVNVTLNVGEGMWHCFALMPSFIPECRQAMDEICSFIKTYVIK